MSKKRETVYLTGKIFWAKIFGPPRTNYNEDSREWAFEFEPNEEAVAMIAERGLSDRLQTGRKRDGTIRRGYEDRKPFLTLKRPEKDYEDNDNDPIRVVDAANQEWSGAKLGNETEVDVKVNIVDYGVGKFKGIYPQAIRILDLVSFVSEEFAPLPSDDPRVKAAKAKTDDFKKDFGLIEDEAEPEATTAAADTTTSSQDLDDDVPL